MKNKIQTKDKIEPQHIYSESEIVVTRKITSAH